MGFQLRAIPPPSTF